MAKNNKTAAGGPKTSPSPTLETLFNTMQILLTRLERIESLSKDISPATETPDSSMELLCSRLDGLAERLERLERALDSDSVHSLEIHTEPQIQLQKQEKKSYASAALSSSKQTPDQVLSNTKTTTTMSHPLPSIPPNSYINRFKRGHTIIRSRPGTEKPFLNLSPMQIVTNVNQALSSINAKIDNSPVQVQAVTRFPSGDVKFITKNRTMARWLLEHKHTWTHLADPNFKTPMATFTVMIHSVPVEFDTKNDNHLETLCTQNDIPPDMIDNMRWLGQPQKNGKTHGTLLINVKDKQLARDIERGCLIIDGIPLKAAKYTPGPPQCFNCLEFGHPAYFCKTPPFCAKCGGKHNSKDCNIENPSGACFRCIKLDQSKKKFTTLTDIKYNHSPFSISCPIKKTEVDKHTKAT
ncbi:hypothetical protein PGT21_050028 [Puccinia graminis f. sp. tritici]|uniref:CCHC-type domain-containing protein n=1 Tax=Puccinia graminis f. sp. tritici TaxID=56615 RepID=A0A5B0MX78_PUCGR|nr:hypothetical protein PGTUg99_050073 [Puccinia graminis f. sp. tritici]KAA1080638.1 hypothetical protein PGT21_050288 [Puccinia graminis f. sp. tritici]KAA1084729.1 hypothetical protein PGT21_050276 [Puccinia graminis f. sp. tritici]KAA1113064.1 hypothetical protein PGT21_050039 [Puccinia graminis f. sp. tritici]KAA1117311.1 hypothetical protein PGT21_050015 [Puccinia graminis f. sp. tritici]